MTRPAEQHRAGMADVHDAALILGCDPSTIRKLVRAGTLQVKDRAENALLFYRCDVDRLADEVNGRPEDPNLCPICRRPLGPDHTVWDPEAPGRPIPPISARDDELCELVAFPVRFCPDCTDIEARIAQRFAERRTTTHQE